MTTILWNLGLCLAFALLLWGPLGRWTLRRFLGDNFPTPRSVAIAVGLGFWGLWVLLVGVVGALYLPVMLVSAAAAAVLTALPLLRRAAASTLHAPASRGATGIVMAAFALVSATYLTIAAASALAPELSFDALNVHLPYARDAAASHRIGFDLNNWSSVMPALPLMSYVTGFLFSGLSLAKLCNTLCYVLTGGVVYYFGRRWGSPLHGIVAATLFWSSPVALYESTTALIDLPLTLYSAIAVLSLLEWTKSEETSFLRLSAISLGLAFGCKYHAAFWILPFGVVMIWRLAGRRTGEPKPFISTLLRYALIVGLLFFPWAFRAWLYTGNPVFPLANGIFRSPYFTPAMEQASWAVFANQGVGRSWEALLALPWTVTFHPGPFHGTLGVIFFFGIVLALLRRKTPQQRYGLVVAGLHFYTWALVAQEIRYLLPLAPLLALLTSFGFLGSGREPMAGDRSDGGANRLRVLKSAAVHAGTWVMLGAAVLSFPSIYRSWVKEWTFWHSYRPPWAYLLGRESPQDFLRSEVPSIYVHDFINRELTSRDRVLLLNDHARYYSRIPTLYSFTVEGEGILLQDTEESVLDRLRAARITHVLLNYNGIAPLPGVQPRRGVYYFLDREFREEHLEALYSKNNVVLYRIRAQ
ncbi:MAG: glycosyltransferase family 39 protein [Acidobacteria bacterium]|nr:glycosyltransferase family 39 protein [Acidobacteriota bacterium]